MIPSAIRCTTLPIDSRFCVLAPGERVNEIADACRSAALGFAWGTHHPHAFGRRELARWLAGPYARAVASTRQHRPSGTLRIVAPRPLEEATIEALVRTARAETLRFLRSAWSWTYDGAAARAAIDEGLVVGIADEESNLGYGAIDRPGMRLVDRVCSLFVADYLTRPADYAAFAICLGCEGATFDGGLYHEACARPRLRTVLRRRAVRELVLPEPMDRDEVDELAQPRW